MVTDIAAPREIATGELDPLAPLFEQLREFGAVGTDSYLEELLDEARMDVRQALHIFFEDGGRRHREMQSGQRFEADMGQAELHLRPARSGARDRRRAKRQGALGLSLDNARVGVQGASGTEHGSVRDRLMQQMASSGQSSTPLTPAAGRKARRDLPDESQRNTEYRQGSSVAAEEEESAMSLREAELKLKPAHRRAMEGREKAAVLKFTSHSGSRYEVDLRTMIQLNVETGKKRAVQRKKRNCWLYKTDSRGWQAYPADFTCQLERVSARLGFHSVSGEPPSPDEGCSTHEMQALLDTALQADPGSMAAADVAGMLGAAFEAATRGPQEVGMAVRLIGQLAQQQGLRCGLVDARRVGLILGSMSLLQAVLASDAAMVLAGAEVYDQKYPSLQMNVVGRKNAIRCLLARGMVLGAAAPSGKLLKKLEADAAPLWSARFLDALLKTWPQMPDMVVVRINSFLG